MTGSECNVTEQGRIFLAADAGQPMSAVTQRAAAGAAELGWAEPGLRAHEGRRSQQLLETAAAAVAASVGASAAAVVFMPAPMLALSAAVTACGRGPAACGAADRLPVVRAVSERARRLQLTPTTLAVDAAGRVPVASVAGAMAAGVQVIVCQVGNPEVGSVSDHSAISRCVKDHSGFVVMDATMAAGRTMLPDPAGWDVLVLSAASWAGGAGVGIVVVKPTTPWDAGAAWGSDNRTRAQMPLRAPGVSACATAALSLEAAVATVELREQRDRRRTAAIRAALSTLPEVVVHGADPRLPHVVGFSVNGVLAETLLLELDRRGISVAAGSACTSDPDAPSAVLTAMGAPTSGNLRITLPMADEVLCGAGAGAWAEAGAGVGADGDPAAGDAAIRRVCEELPAAIAAIRAELV